MADITKTQCEHKIREWIHRSIQAKNALTLDDYKIGQIYKVAQVLTKTIENDHKVMVCGNGGSAADSAHFVGELLNQFCMGRTAALPAIDLSAMNATITAIANDWGFEDVFSKQVQAFGVKGDLLIAISTSGNSPNVLHAILEARRLEITTILLTGNTAGKPLPSIKRRVKGKEIASIVVEPDMTISVPSDHTPIIQESHTMILHILVYMLDWLRTGVDYFDKETW